MNYQVANFWFYKPAVFLTVIIAFGLIFTGLSAPLFYLMAVGLIFPVVVSMRLHVLKEKGRALLLSEGEAWTVYINGIPVQKRRSALKNPAFASVARLRTFYLRTFSLKLVIQGAALVMILWQVWQIENPLILALATLLVAADLWLMSGTVNKLRAVMAERWEIASQQNADGSAWHMAFFSRQPGQEPLLKSLLALA